MLKLPIYLDHNATTPCDPRVVEAMLPYFSTSFGNAASRSHAFGWQAEEAVDLARQQVARLIGAEASEIVFTSGSTESCNLALKGVFEAYSVKGNHIITCATEHKAVLDSCSHLEKLGAEVTIVPVDASGQPDLVALESAFRKETILVALMYANNETGVVSPVSEIGRMARKHDVLFFSDATQAVGKLPVSVAQEGPDLLALSAHKIYGPKGAGALFLRRKNPRVKVAAQIDGGGHEKGRRSGTLNVPGIVGLGKACEICYQEMQDETVRLQWLRDKLEAGLLQIEGSAVNGDRVNRLPQTLNISFRHTESEGLIGGFHKDIAVSSGSACMSATIEPSYVLKAMGLEDDLAKSSVRFSIGRFTTEEEIDYTIGRVTQAVKEHRQASQLWGMYQNGDQTDAIDKSACR